MRYIYLVIPLIFILGCSTKQFEPKVYFNKTLKYQNSKELYGYTRKNETFRISKGFISTKNIYYDESGNKLGKFKKINKDLAGNFNEILLIKEKRVIKFPFRVYSATKSGDKIAVVFENNGYCLFSLKKNKIIFYQKDDDAISSKYLSASPLFYKDLILYPLLNGKIAIVDSKTSSFIRNIDISDDSVVDNIIYLKIVKDSLFMATPKKLVLFNPNFLISYKGGIKHIIDDGKNLFVFNVDGTIIKFNTNLKKIKQIELPFADYLAPGICRGNIYTVTSNGYLLKISPDLKVKVYKTGQFDTGIPLRIKGCKIYNGKKVFFIE